MTPKCTALRSGGRRIRRIPRKLASLVLAGGLLLATLPAQAAERFITLASTTSTQNSGLFRYLLPIFTKETGIEVRVVAVGTGQAIKIGERGDADALLVHDTVAELEFLHKGFASERRDVMYNDFIVVGPRSDPAGVSGMTDCVAAFQKIAAARSPFASRADDSGTHRMELRLWKAAAVDAKAASGTWYRETGSGMGATLNTASGMDAYTLTDRGSWANFGNRGNLVIAVQGDKRLFNQYGVLPVNPARFPHVKRAEAMTFTDWLTSPHGQETIRGYQIKGETLFFPNAKNPKR
jgi:tungstate transport system substrate-binding protein